MIRIDLRNQSTENGQRRPVYHQGLAPVSAICPPCHRSCRSSSAVSCRPSSPGSRRASLVPCWPLVPRGLRHDPSAVVTACAGFRAAPDGPGAPCTFTIAQLVRAEIVRAWADSCSDRDLEKFLPRDLVVRWFVGMSLVGPTPDHSTLNCFHAWVTEHAPDAWFRAVLAFLRHHRPVGLQHPHL